MHQIINWCAKGSRKTGAKFIEDTLAIAEVAQAIEIHYNYPQDRNFDNELNFLKKLSQEKGIKYAVHAPYLNNGLNDFNEKIRQATLEEMFASIDRAEFLGAQVVTIHPPFEPYGLKFPERISLEHDSYSQIAKYATKKEIKIGLENEAKTCFFFPDRACLFLEIKKIIESIDSEFFGYTLDFGHGNISGINLKEAIELAGSKLFHIHAHDNLGTKDPKIDPHLPPGNGNINWKIILNTLQNIKYNQYFEIESSLENFTKGKDYLTSLK
ncbi:MAG: sugar phosphate isomerase/epimerase family protein [bacterium]|nr:sugar phosphate isomerase/epimerase family protein [bacterium]